MIYDFFNLVYYKKSSGQSRNIAFHVTRITLKIEQNLYFGYQKSSYLKLKRCFTSEIKSFNFVSILQP